MMMGEAGVDRAILVPPSWEGNRNDHALEAAARYPIRFAVLGRLAPDQPDNAKRLQTWKSQPGMLGIRQTFVLDHERTWMSDGTTNWFWKGAEAANIPVMLHATGLMKELGLIAERHPGLTIILDHFGLSSRVAKEGRVQETIDSTAALSKHKNVHVKVSAAPAYSSESLSVCGHAPIQRLIVASYLGEALLLGVPIFRTRLKRRDRQCVTLFTEELKFLADDDKEWIMGRALAECLGWKI